MKSILHVRVEVVLMWPLNNFLLATLMVKYYLEKNVFHTENRKLTSGVAEFFLQLYRK